jgi:hypothetical protein
MTMWEISLWPKDDISKPPIKDICPEGEIEAYRQEAISAGFGFTVDREIPWTEQLAMMENNPE